MRRPFLYVLPMTAPPAQPVSTKPYLIRALYDWCVDNGFTPHIVVIVDEHTRVPMAYVREGQIVLNIAPYATHELMISNDHVTCQARFGGVAHALVVPIINVAAIYARENGQGMAFETGQDASATGIPLNARLQDAADDDNSAEAATSVPSGDASDDAPEDRPPPPPGRASHLRVVK